MLEESEADSRKRCHEMDFIQNSFCNVHILVCTVHMYYLKVSCKFLKFTFYVPRFTRRSKMATPSR
jgi:hypothetical protein